MAKKTVDQGFIQELAKGPAKPDKLTKAFEYKKPIAKVDKIQNMAVNSRTREHRSARTSKTSNFAIEQNFSRESHKGKK